MKHEGYKEVGATRASGGDAKRALQSLMKQIMKHQRYDNKRAVWQLVNSMVPYFGLCYLAYVLLNVSYWAVLPVCILAALFLVRIFIIAHDCGHGSFMKSKKAREFWGSVGSILTFIPYFAWRHEHARHHANSGDLDHRGFGDIKTMTVEEYRAASRWERFKYRAYRFPAVMFIIGPLYTFLISYRFSPPNARPRVRRSYVRNNLFLLGLLVLMHFTIGLKTYVLIQLPIIGLAGSLGIWMFYVQHQFEGVYWERHDKWDYLEQALKGSSFYKLPRILQWFTGNIGFHHVHHLGPRIPNYFLDKCHYEVEALRRVKPLTLRQSLKSLKLRLWDEERRMLVGFAEARA